MNEIQLKQEFTLTQEIKDLVSSMSDEELNSLSDEEFNKIHAVLSGSQNSSAEKNDSAQTIAPSQLESGVRGFAQGITLNFADEMVAAGKTLVDIAGSDHTWGERSTLYDKNVTAERSLNDEAAKANPKTYLGGQLGGGLSTLVMPGTAAFGTTIKGSMLIAGAAGYGDSTGWSDAYKIPLSMAAAGILTKGGRVLGKALAGTPEEEVSHQLAKLTEQKSIKLAQSLGFKGVGYDGLLEGIAKRGSTPPEFTSDILSIIPISETTSKAELAALMQSGKQSTWQHVDSVHQAIDHVNPLGIVNTKELISEIKYQIEPKLDLISPELKERLLVNLEKRIGVDLENPRTSLQELQKIKGKVSELFSKSSDPAIQSAGSVAIRTITNSQRNAVESLPDVINLAVPEMVNVMGQNLTGINLYKAYMRQYGALEEGSSFIQHAANQEALDMARYGDSILDLKTKAKQLLTGQWRTLAGEIAQPGSITGKTGLVAEVADLIKGNRNNFRDVRGLISSDRMYNALKQNPGRYYDKVADIVLGASKGTDHFVRALGYLDATISLENDPVPPTLEGIKSKAADISALLGQQAPQLKAVFDKAIVTNDENAIGSMISSIRMLPDAAAYFQPGLGMDGKIYSDIDKVKALQQTDHMNWSHGQRMAAKEDIIKYHKVPQFQQPPALAITPERLIATRNGNGQKVQKL